ncbi:MAG: hypothetical protein DVB31_01705 [Verrucomicrobia bacterium]|nr:MAG: hypothetical protein DVB31_01705 [Verrucomicrobiota bacterium]
MKATAWMTWGVATGVLARVAAQSVLFDFDSAPIGSPLPLDLSAGGLTASFSATGKGFSIQRADTMGFTPPGFSGLCLYPSSVFAADLIVMFSQPLVGFSILYSPQELGCDDSATLRATAYRNQVEVGIATATATNPGTWPTETLRLDSATPFDRVVVVYASRPPTCQEWGPIFMADNMAVTPAPQPPVLRVARSAGKVEISWPTTTTGFVLQSSADPLEPNSWLPVAQAPVTSADWETIAVEPAAARAFFRLAPR